ncbi:MAG: SGNH/GDSL hydrolase family protein [Kiritimatiellae bacterium]|nr:SGNH/GDSL hydrolase family protein [Kiritimatiellia bacterium]
MKRICIFIVTLLGLMVQLAGAEIFKNGDKVCFLGDSITHAGSFHYDIYNYYMTRFPGNNVQFFQAGVAGDTAGGCMRRLNEDVFSGKPNIIAIMFGMNDVCRVYYVKNPPPALMESQQKALTIYRNNMDNLVKALVTNVQARLMFITPSPFDDTAINDQNNNQAGCNDGLGKCAEIVKALAARSNSEVVDLHTPMTAFNHAQQKNNPRFTIIGPDRIHPDEPGQLMMAWLFLKEQGAPAIVSAVTLDASGKVEACDNASVENVTSADGQISFSLLEKALPFPIDPAAEPVLNLIPVIQDLNRELLAVKGLAAEKYELLIDGNSVGTFAKNELARGINLATNAAAPQFKQAQRVAAASSARRAEEAKLRDMAAVRWFFRSKVNVDDLEAVKKFYETLKNKIGYFERKLPDYIAKWESRGDIVKAMEKKDTEVRALCVPIKHTYLLKAAL